MKLKLHPVKQPSREAYPFPFTNEHACTFAAAVLKKVWRRFEFHLLMQRVEQQVLPYSARSQAEELLTLTKPLFKFDSGESAQTLRDYWDAGPEPQPPGPDGVSKDRAVSFRFAV